MNLERAPRHRHSPRVRRLASQAGLSLAAVVGTGPSGRVTPRDVLAVASAGGSVAGSAPMPAPATSVVEVDLTAVVALRERTAGGQTGRPGTRLTLMAFVAKAVVEALRANPLLNASTTTDGETVARHASQHLGLAVDTTEGRVVPVVWEAGDLTLPALCRRIDDVVAAAHAGSLTPDQLTGGTFTLTDSGRRGVLWDTPIPVPGQVGILSTGTVVERPMVVRLPDGERGIAIRSVAHFALTYDQRAVDGVDAARFLSTVKDRLEAGRFQDDVV